MIETIKEPVAIMDFAAVQKTAYDQEGYCAALSIAAAKISPSDQVLFQFFHETAHKNERTNRTAYRVDPFHNSQEIIILLC
ncbi:hypothetical protein TIFTF001_037579 [Ficus carica]|uniref:Uncharacterized protein n=1 Tax=Ficus carica TaxID=3494 RepID=A0AA88J945_FICCA|nr:hypothetical protein TIFTF001_037579 [Ficus carica]